MICAMMFAPLYAEENKSVPDISLDQVGFAEVINEVGFSKDALKGKVVVVERWSTKCGPCVSFLPELAKIHRRYDSKGLEVVGLETGGSDKDAIVKLCKSARVEYPIMKGGRVPVRINRIPHACVYDSSGKLVWEGNPHEGGFLDSVRDALRDIGKEAVSGEAAEEATSNTGPMIAMREWKNNEGKIIRAELLRVEDGKVVFKISHREVPYEISKLSDEDQKLIRDAVGSKSGL